MPVCKNCENSFEGKFCNLCGEKILVPEEKSLSHFVGNFLSAVLNADNKFFRSFVLIFTYPGRLSLQFTNGIRKKYFPPLSLFLLANVLYFLFSFFETFNSTLRAQMYMMPHSTLVRQMVEKKIKKGKTTLDKFRFKYEAQSSQMAKLLVIIFVFFTAASLHLLFYSSKAYFTDHLTLALEFNSFNLLLNNFFFPMILIGLIYFFLMLRIDLRPYINDDLVTTFTIITSVIFFVKAFREFYGQQRIWAILKALLLIYVLFLSLEIYRFILFFATIWTV